MVLFCFGGVFNLFWKGFIINPIEALFGLEWIFQEFQKQKFQEQNWVILS